MLPFECQNNTRGRIRPFPRACANISREATWKFVNVHYPESGIQLQMRPPELKTNANEAEKMQARPGGVCAVTDAARTF